jgi:hypothetical protein
MSRWNSTLDAVSENLGLKLVSLVIAIGVFAFVRGSGTTQRSVDVPLLAMLPQGGDGKPVLLSSLPDKVRLTVRGASSVVSGLRAEELGPVQLDLRAGRRPLVRLGADLLSLPAGARFVSVEPSSLALSWDVSVTRLIPVRPSVVGTLPPRARVSVLDVEPARLRVRGPSLYVDPIVSVHTDEIDTTGLSAGRYERRIALESLRAGVDYEAAAGVRVTFEIVPTVGERRFAAVPVAVLGAARVQLRPPVVSVEVRGDPEAVEALAPSQLVPFVDPGPPPWTHGTTALAVQLRPLPAGLSAVITPAEVLAVSP